MARRPSGASRRDDLATAALLWAGSRPDPDPSIIAATIDAGADVERAIASAIRNRTGPLCCRALELAGHAGEGPVWEHARRDAESRRIGRAAEGIARRAG